MISFSYFSSTYPLKTIVCISSCVLKCPKHHKFCFPPIFSSQPLLILHNLVPLSQTSWFRALSNIIIFVNKSASRTKCQSILFENHFPDFIWISLKSIIIITLYDRLKTGIILAANRWIVNIARVILKSEIQISILLQTCGKIFVI